MTLKDTRKRVKAKFELACDKVSYAMGTPTNIIFWILAVACWFVIFATGLEKTQGEWFTSNSFNFPLNTVTTLAELYIGFLVGAAANRSERSARSLAEQQTQIILAIKSEEDDLVGEGKTMASLLNENTKLTKLVKEDTQLLMKIHDHLEEVMSHLGMDFQTDAATPDTHVEG